MKNIFKSVGIYFLGNVLSKIIMFFLLPIYTKYISVEGMGIYDIEVTIITLFSGMIFLNIGTTIMKYKLEPHGYDGNSVFTEGVYIFTLSSIAYFSILAVCGIFYKVDYFFWVLMYGFIYAFNDTVGYCARSLGYNTEYAAAGVIQTLLTAVTNIIFIIFLEMDYSSLLISFAIAALLSSIYLIIKSKIYKSVSMTYRNKSVFKEMIIFSLPLCINSIAFWLLSSSSKVITTYFLGPEANGFLSIANRFTSVVYLISSCVQLTWQEIAFAHDNDEKATGDFYSNMFVFYYKSVIFFILVMVPSIRLGLAFYPSFINETYAASIDLIPVALLGTGLAIISLFIGTTLTSIKKNGTVFFSTLTGAIGTILGTLFFLYMDLGVASANYGFIFGYTVTIFVRIIFLKKYMNFKSAPWNMLFLLVLCCVSVYVYSKMTLIYQIILLLVLLFIGILYFRKEVTMVLGRLKNG